MRAKLKSCCLKGSIQAPPSKSLSHRCLISAGLARGESLVEGLEFSNDVKVTCECLRRLGAKVDTDASGARLQGMGFPQQPVLPLDCGESGSTLRFFIPIAGLLKESVRMEGHGRLPQRPQDVYKTIFEERGLLFQQDDTGLTLTGPLTPGTYRLRGDVSSQFITGLLFALPLLAKDSVIELIPPVESRSYIALTLSALADFGVTARWQNENTLFVPGNQQYRAGRVRVEGDYSQAAFPAVLGAVCGGITVTGLRPQSLQGDAVIMDILERCGAGVYREGDAVRLEKAPLNACEIDLADCPDLGPILTVLAQFCSGTTVIKNAGRLRIKESDRIASMQEELRKFGGDLRCEGDTLYIEGGKPLHAPDAVLHGHNDHRIVMALAVLCFACGFEAQIEDAQAVNKSWPGFFEDMAGLGGKVEYPYE